MVTEIEAYNFDDSLLVFKIFIDDSKITKDNMYSRGLDPHYLIDFHIKEILPYFSIPRTVSLGFILIGPDGEVVHSFLG